MKGRIYCAMVRKLYTSVGSFCWRLLLLLLLVRDTGADEKGRKESGVFAFKELMMNKQNGVVFVLRVRRKTVKIREEKSFLSSLSGYSQAQALAFILLYKKLH